MLGGGDARAVAVAPDDEQEGEYAEHGDGEPEIKHELRHVKKALRSNGELRIGEKLGERRKLAVVTGPNKPLENLGVGPIGDVKHDAREQRSYGSAKAERECQATGMQ